MSFHNLMTAPHKLDFHQAELDTPLRQIISWALIKPRKTTYTVQGVHKATTKKLQLPYKKQEIIKARKLMRLIVERKREYD